MKQQISMRLKVVISTSFEIIMEKYIYGFHAWKTFAFFNQYFSVHIFQFRQN